MIPWFLYSWLTGGGNSSLMCWPHFMSEEDSWYSFLLEAESTHGAKVLLEELCSYKKYASSVLSAG
jgi:hypothetical protein